MRNSTNTKIIICDMCKGSGVTHYSELEDYHRSEYKDHDLICTNCLGQGRLEEVTTVKITPYTPEGILLSKADHS